MHNFHKDSYLIFCMDNNIDFKMAEKYWLKYENSNTYHEQELKKCEDTTKYHSDNHKWEQRKRKQYEDEINKLKTEIENKNKLIDKLHLELDKVHNKYLHLEKEITKYKDNIDKMTYMPTAPPSYEDLANEIKFKLME